MSSHVEPMSALETELIDKAFCGEWAGIPELPTSLPVSQQAAATVGGAFLRKLLLGLIPARATAGHNPRIHGIRLQGAIINGEIDLRDCIGIEGAPLPPLLLECCIIHKGFSKKNPVVNKGVKEQEEILSAINASNTWLSRLSLKECRLDGRVDLTDATLGGDLELSDLEPLNAACCCQISLRRCRIDGSVIAQRTRLRIRRGQCTEFGMPDYALNLVSAEVHGSVWLQPEFFADGGVSVRGAHVHGNIWAAGAEFIASSEIAFRAESLQCDGVVSLRGNKKTRVHCGVKGILSFLAASVGYLDLRGIHVARSENKEESTADLEPIVDFNLARVRDNCDLGTVFERKESTVEAIVDGYIEAHGMAVGGNFDLTGLLVNLPKNSKDWGIGACNLKVGGDLILDHFSSSIDLSSGHVERNLKVKNSTMEAPRNLEYGLQAYNVTIGNDFDLEGVSGAVDLELSRIGGALTIYAGDLTARAGNLTALNAKEVEVRGSVKVSGRFRPSKKNFLCFAGGSYQSGFYVGSDKNGLTIILGDPASRGCLHDLMFSMENACIENNFCVGKVKVKLEKGDGHIANERLNDSVIVSLNGLKARVFQHMPDSSWGRHIKLKLTGFEYDRIEPTPTNRDSLNIKPKKSPCESIVEKLKVLFPPCRQTTGPLINSHMSWLSLQNRTMDGYEPQPYEQLAQALRNDGRFEDAKHITFKKLKLERERMKWGISRGFFSIMERGFDYGLFPCKSVLVFFGLWMIGWAGFFCANSKHHPVLVLNAPAVSTIALPGELMPLVSPEHGGPSVGMKEISKNNGIVLERHCGDEVDTLWYALDVFVPLLDLKQEDKCSITTQKGIAHWIYRALSTLYEILGAIVTPIMLLSVSGLLRRYVEE